MTTKESNIPMIGISVQMPLYFRNIMNERTTEKSISHEFNKIYKIIYD